MQYGAAISGRRQRYSRRIRSRSDGSKGLSIRVVEKGRSRKRERERERLNELGFRVRGGSPTNRRESNCRFADGRIADCKCKLKGRQWVADSGPVDKEVGSLTASDAIRYDGDRMAKGRLWKGGGGVCVQVAARNRERHWQTRTTAVNLIPCLGVPDPN